LALTAGWIDRHCKNISHQETTSLSKKEHIGGSTLDDVWPLCEWKQRGPLHVGTIPAGGEAAYDGLRVEQPFCVERHHEGESK